MSLLNTLINPTQSERKPTLRPSYEITETETGYALTVFLPGVAKADLEVSDEEGNLRIAGKRSTPRPEKATVLHREISDYGYELVLAHDGTVDAGRITAELKDGVLALTLPKAESAKPRKIAVA